jgi:hypothetical protein
MVFAFDTPEFNDSEANIEIVEGGFSAGARTGHAAFRNLFVGRR